MIKIHNISIHGVQIRKSSILTCGDVNVCDIHSVTQGQGNAAVAQDAPQVVQCRDICNIQLHTHRVFNLS